MDYVKLARNNIKRNAGNYTTYFVSAVFSVIVFYIFCSIAYNPQFAELSKMSVKVNTAFTVSAIVVALFSAIFIWYSNTFFIRTRKKEIATYALLGMRKSNIARLLFYENAMLGLLALIIGVLSGTLFSRLFSMILLNLMKDVSRVNFILVPKAIIATLIIFSLLFFVNSVHSYTLIYRFRIIELFRQSSEGDKAPKASLFIALLSVAMIIAGYMISILNAKTTPKMMLFFAVLILTLVVSGTYMLFGSFSVIVLTALKKVKRFYYKGINLIGLSQVLYRIRSNARTLATITVLSAVTISAVCSTYAYYQSNYDAIKDYANFSIMYRSEDKKLNSRVQEAFSRHPEVKTVSMDDLDLICTKSYSKTYPGPYGRGNGSFNTYIISQSQYNRASRHQGNKTDVQIERDNECYFLELSMESSPNEKLKGETVTTEAAGTNMNFKITGSTAKRLLNINLAATTLVVHDNVYERISKIPGIQTLKVRGYVLSEPLKSVELNNELKQLIPEDMCFSSYRNTFTESFKGAGVLVFIGMFLGVLFLLATGSIIFFKLLIEARENREKYKMLMKIGVNKKEIRRTVSGQLLAVFGMPLVLGIIHAAVALATLQISAGMFAWGYFLPMIGLYVLLYAGYYIACVYSYVNIVSSTSP